MLNIFFKLRRRVLPPKWQKQRGRTFAKTTTQVNDKISKIGPIIFFSGVQDKRNSKVLNLYDKRPRRR